MKTGISIFTNTFNGKSLDSATKNLHEIEYSNRIDKLGKFIFYVTVN